MINISNNIRKRFSKRYIALYAAALSFKIKLAKLSLEVLLMDLQEKNLKKPSSKTLVDALVKTPARIFLQIKFHKSLFLDSHLNYLLLKKKHQERFQKRR